MKRSSSQVLRESSSLKWQIFNHNSCDNLNPLSFRDIKIQGGKKKEQRNANIIKKTALFHPKLCRMRTVQINGQAKCVYVSVYLGEDQQVVQSSVWREEHGAHWVVRLVQPVCEGLGWKKNLLDSSNPVVISKAVIKNYHHYWLKNT